MDETNILRKQLESAPKEIRDLIESGYWNIVVDDIAKKNSFSNGQQVALENEVLFVLIDMELSSNLVANIQSSLNIEPVLAQAVTAEIHERILKPIEKYLPTESDVATSPLNPPVSPPEIAPNMLPETLPGQIVHEVPHTEFQAPNTYMPVNTAPAVTAHTTPPVIPKPATSIPPIENKISYPAGQDPYREPIE